MPGWVYLSIMIGLYPLLIFYPTHRLVLIVSALRRRRFPADSTSPARA